jgi:methionyl aminopeptidase
MNKYMKKISIKTSEELKIMRQAGLILQEVQNEIRLHLKGGVSLKYLDEIAEKAIRSRNSEPAFKGLYGFPATCCMSVNAAVVHGIPDNRQLKNGDLISIDCGVLYKNLFSDATFSVVVGGDDKNRKRAKFSACVKDALIAGCAAARTGNFVGDIGYVIQKVVEKGGYSVCREYGGHGLGRELHEEPFVFNFGRKGTGKKLQSGMTLAIEPVIASGLGNVKTLQDGWTVVTIDGKDACQWEHCGVVTPDGLEIFA